jgi:molybdopterin-guanine dinucleotide biosynthesis protein A
LHDFQPKTPCSAAILSGGLCSRMGGRNKAFLAVGGKPILDRVIDTLTPFFPEILLVTRQPELYQNRSVRIVTDIYDARSSLTGIHAALVHAGTDHVLVVPCDAPFLSPAVIRLLLDALAPDVDVVVPQYEDHFEPLCAIYSKRCLPYIEAQLEAGDYTIYNFFDRIKLKPIHAQTLKTADAKMRSFFNVNTPKAHRACEEVAGAEDDGRGDDRR